jgi:hypothetical protein
MAARQGGQLLMRALQRLPGADEAAGSGFATHRWLGAMQSLGLRKLLFQPSLPVFQV